MPNYHTSKQSSSVKINLTSTGSTLAMGEQSLAKAKAHAIIMIFSWMVFASTAILIARYFKFMLPDKTICGTKIWFTIHRTLMILTLILSIISLLIILSYVNWTWIMASKHVNFTHSIFGIVVIVFTFILVKKFESIFIHKNYLHSSTQ